jgi:tetratricopeptide (TPR) repeat protein
VAATPHPDRAAGPLRIAGIASIVVFALAVGLGIVTSLRNDGRLPPIDILPPPLVRDLAERGEWDRVASELVAALRFNVGPQRRPQYLTRLGLAHSELGQSDAAIARFSEALALRPDALDPRRRLVNELARVGRLDEVVVETRALLEHSPDEPDVREYLARTLERLGDPEAAALEYERAIALQPDAAGLRVALATLRAELGDRDGAIAELRRANRLRPADAVIQNNLAWMLATHPDETSRRPDEAIALARRSVELSADASALDTLAIALASAGRFDEAIAVAERAEQVARSQGSRAEADAIAQRRERYRAGSPVTSPSSDAGASLR